MNDFTQRKDPLMATVDSKNILIFGGYNNHYLSDGLLLDSESGNVLRRFDEGEINFDGRDNRVISTEYGTVFAIIYDCEHKIKLVEIKNYQLRVLEDDLSTPFSQLLLAKTPEQPRIKLIQDGSQRPGPLISKQAEQPHIDDYLESVQTVQTEEDIDYDGPRESERAALH